MFNNFDQFLSENIDGIGRWHILFIVTLTTVSMLPLAFFSQFAFAMPYHYCRQPFATNVSWSQEEVINFTIPFKASAQSPPMIGQAFEPCLEYDIDGIWEYLGPNTTLPEAIILRQELFPNISSCSCRHGITFMRGMWSSAVFGVKFLLVCKRQYLIPLSNAMYFVGMLIGFFLSTPISKCIGRRHVCLVFTCIYTVFGIGTAFVNHMGTFILLRFLTAITATITSITGVVFISEWLNADQRGVFGYYRKFHTAAISRGLFALSFYVTPSWRYGYAFYFLMSLPVFCGLCLWHESPRWLISKDRIDDAENSVVAVIRSNGIKLSEEENRKIKYELNSLVAFNHICNGDGEETDSTDRKCCCHKESCRNCGMVDCNMKFYKQIIPWILIWVAAGFLSIGLQFNVVRLGENHYLIALFTGFMLVPGALLQYLGFRFVGRKWSITMTTSGISTGLMIAFLLTYFQILGTPVVVACMISITFAEALLAMIYVQTPRVFPPNLGTFTLGICAATSRVGMIFASFVECLDELVWLPLPLLIFAATALLATFVSFFLISDQGEIEE